MSSPNSSAPISYFPNSTGLDDPHSDDHEMESSHTEEMSLVIVSILIGLIILLCVLLGVLLFPPVWYFIRRKIPVSPAKIKRRYQTIDAWLITKRVSKKCDNCDKTIHHQRQDDQQQQDQSQFGNQTQVDAECCSQSDDMITATGNECLVCMELFKVGDKVSWSANETCEHVFHHSCIREWLLRHTDCPCCRRLFLPVDCARTKLSGDILRDMATERSRRRRKTAFCIHDGLVVVTKINDNRRHNDSTDTPTSIQTFDTLHTVQTVQSQQMISSDHGEDGADIEARSGNASEEDEAQILGGDEGPVSIWSWY